MRHSDRSSTSAAAARWLIAASALALGGAGIATYLTVVHYAGQPIVCSRVGDCELVNSSRYATIEPVPVALLGVASYVSILILVVLAWLRRSVTVLAAGWGHRNGIIRQFDVPDLHRIVSA